MSTRGSFLRGVCMAGKVTVLIDGFNVYHSIRDALARTPHRNLKWLNYRSMCQSFINDVVYLQGSSIARIYYFSALARHAGRDVVMRHKLYIQALESAGVEVVTGNFKKKFPKCKHCHREYLSHEEKESDVNIALQMVRSLMSDECDTIVLIGGDTDLVSAVRTAKELFRAKQVGVAFPYRRENTHFKTVADFTFNISVDSYKNHQFADPLTLKDGSVINKPPLW